MRTMFIYMNSDRVVICEYEKSLLDKLRIAMNGRQEKKVYQIMEGQSEYYIQAEHINYIMVGPERGE